MDLVISLCFLPILYSQKVYFIALNYFIIFLGAISDMSERYEFIDQSKTSAYNHVEDVFDYTLKYLQPVFLGLEFIYQCYRRRMFCFK